MTSPFSSAQEAVWLKKFEAALKDLPAEDSREIVREVQDHLHERIRQGQNTGEVLLAFGDAGEYANSFLDEYVLTRARDGRHTVRMFTTVAHFAQRSLVAGTGFVLASVFALLIAGSLICVTIKIIRPDRVGLWVDRPLGTPHRYVHSGPVHLPLRLGDDHVQFGYSSPQPALPEILGSWIYPCLLGLAAAGYLGLRLTLLRTLQLLSGKPI